MLAVPATAKRKQWLQESYEKTKILGIWLRATERKTNSLGIRNLETFVAGSYLQVLFQRSQQWQQPEVFGRALSKKVLCRIQHLCQMRYSDPKARGVVNGTRVSSGFCFQDFVSRCRNVEVVYKISARRG